MTAKTDDGRALAVCLVNGARDATITRTLEVPWRILRRVMTTCKRVEANDKLEAPGWFPARLRDGAAKRREDINVEALSSLVLDIDDGSDLVDVVDRLAEMGLACALHTTWSHRPDHHKARVVFPLSEDCPADRWLDTWRAADAWARSWGAHIDKACKNPSRLYFQPALPSREWVPRAGWFVGQSFAGQMLSWRWLQAYWMPPPDPVWVAPPPATTAGARYDEIDRESRKRRAFARAVVDHRAQKIRCAGPGKGQRGRNAHCYTAGRAAGQLVAAGAIHEGDAVAALMQAAADAGLSAQEAHRAITNGIRRGKEDGAWDFTR